MIKINIEKKLNSSFGNMLLQFQEEIQSHQFVTLFGKSGAGKTSTLRILAGLLNPDSGTITVEKSKWLNTSESINLPPQKRSVGFVFQDYALFPNMTVKENLDFALAKNQDTKVIHELIELMELGALQNQKPSLLSGGQKQRVALARTLVKKPKLLLLDEPLSALDLEMRNKLQKYLLQVHQEFKLTTILISHDISEIIKLSDQVFVLDHGKVIQRGSPIDIFSNKNPTGKISFKGEIVAISNIIENPMLTIVVGNEILQLNIDSTQLNDLNKGDRISVSSLEFNPIIKKI